MKRRLLSIALALILILAAFPMSAKAATQDGYVLESKHFIWECGTKYLKGNISPENFALWLSRLDRVYEAMADLTGREPFDGRKTVIQEGTEHWATAGYDNCINWNADVIAAEMNDINSGSWSFGIMHEIGHIFDFDSAGEQWTFDTEFSANLKVIYAVGTLQAQVSMDGQAINTLDGMYNHFHQFAVQDDGDDKRYGDKLLCAFIDIARTKGWEPLKKTYRSYLQDGELVIQDYMFTGEYAKMLDFMDRLHRVGSVRLADHYYNTKAANIMKAHYTGAKIARTEILANEFRNGDYISIHIPDSVTKIGDAAFAECLRLKTIAIPSGVTEVDTWVFAGCISLERVVFPESVKRIGGFALADCIALLDVYIYARDAVIEPNAIRNRTEKLAHNLFPTTIHGYRGSTAEAYAYAYGLGFVALPEANVSDISTASAWAQPIIKVALTLNLVTPDLQNDYTANTTRAEFCRAAVNFMEQYYGSTTSALLAERGLTAKTFADTNDPIIGAAAALGITAGTDAEKNLFSPDGLLTREQAATMLHNLLYASGWEVLAENALWTWSDKDEISPWAAYSVNVMDAVRVMSGTSTTVRTFSPKMPYTHEQSIATLYNLRKYLAFADENNR